MRRKILAILSGLRNATAFCFLVIPVFNLFMLVDEGPQRNANDAQQPASRLSDNARLDLLGRLARQNSSSKAFAAARIYISEARDLAKRKNLPLPYTVLWADAEVMYAQKDVFGALQAMEKACQILILANRYPEIAEAGLFRARLLLNLGKFDEAIDQYEELIRLAEEKNLKKIIPECYRGLADVYNSAGKSSEEKKAILSLIENSKKDSNLEYLARGYFRLGQFSNNVDSDFTASNSFYKQALSIREKKGDSLLFPVILNRISWNYYLLHQLDTAFRYYERTLDISLKLNNYPTVSNAYGNMGTICRDKKEYEKALYFYGKSNAYALIVKDWFELSWVNKDMSDMYVRMGDYKKAYESFVLYKNYSDSISQQKYSVGLADARMKYETDSKEKALEMVNLKLKQQKYFIFGLSGFIFLLLLIGFLIFRQFRLNSKRQISEMNRRISEITQANLRQQMNPHFIFNTLNSIQYYMYQHDKLAVNNYLTKFSSLMRKTLENSQHTAIPLQDEVEALELYLELESLRFKEKFEYSIQIDEEIDRLIYKIPTMILQPYVENAIGHGLINKEGKGKLDIGIQLKEDCLYCTVEDNGVGREEAGRIKEGRVKHHPPLGTRIAESRLELANAFYGTGMKVQYTDLKDEEGKATGTRVEIQIPIMT